MMQVMHLVTDSARSVTWNGVEMVLAGTVWTLGG